MTKTPPVAIWILEHAVTNPQALVGDVVELRQAGRSRAWVLRQVLQAVAVEVGRQARRHPWLTLSGVVSAWVLSRMLWAAVYGVHNYAVELAVLAGGPRAAIDRPIPFASWILLAGFVAQIATGWLTGRLHRRAHLSGVVGFCLVVATLVLLARHHYYLAAVRSLIGCAGLVFGALLSARPEPRHPVEPVRRLA